MRFFVLTWSAGLLFLFGVVALEAAEVESPDSDGTWELPLEEMRKSFLSDQELLAFPRLRHIVFPPVASREERTLLIKELQRQREAARVDAMRLRAEKHGFSDKPHASGRIRPFLQEQGDSTHPGVSVFRKILFPPAPSGRLLPPASEGNEGVVPSGIFEFEGLSVPPLPVESSLLPASDESENAASSGIFESEGLSVPPLPVESSLLPASDESESAAPSDVFESEGFSVPPLPVESSLLPASDASESAAPSDVFESEGLSVPSLLQVPPAPRVLRVRCFLLPMGARVLASSSGEFAASASDGSESAAPSDVFESEGLSVPPLPVESSLLPASDESESAAPFLSPTFLVPSRGAFDESSAFLSPVLGEFVASCFRCESAAPSDVFESEGLFGSASPSGEFAASCFRCRECCPAFLSPRGSRFRLFQWRVRCFLLPMGARVLRRPAFLSPRGFRFRLSQWRVRCFLLSMRARVLRRPTFLSPRGSRFRLSQWRVRCFLLPMRARVLRRPTFLSPRGSRFRLSQWRVRCFLLPMLAR